MRKSIEVGILIVSVLLALSIFVALAENQASKEKVNATKLNTTNNTTNITVNNTTSGFNPIAKNKTANNTTNTTNPFAKVRGDKPDDTNDN